MSDRTFEYLLNRMEHAGQQENPAEHGYGPARKAVLAHEAALRAKQLQLLKQLAAAEEALRPFAHIVRAVESRYFEWEPTAEFTVSMQMLGFEDRLKWGDFARAAAALRALEEKDGR